MQISSDDTKADALKKAADTFFGYLRDVIYKPSRASLDLESLPEAFADFGKGLLFFCDCVIEARSFAHEIAAGNLNSALPSPDNEIASSLKSLHASLKHLTWQAQQVAKGDYNQHVDYMGDFSGAFNSMTKKLEQQRKIDQAEKAKLEMYMRLILMNCPSPILLFDGQGKLAYIADSYFQYCKTFRPEEILGFSLHDLLAPVVSEQSLNEIEHLYKNALGEKHAFETEQDIVLGVNDALCHFKIDIIPMLDTAKNIEGMFVIFFDISESINARREAERARELAEQSSRAKSNFLAKMSHEIRTPMNAIIGMAELAMSEKLSLTVQDKIVTIKQAGSNLLSIINDILDFSKIETGKLEIIPEEYSFSTLINDVINIIRMKMIESRLRFVVDVDSAIPGVLFGDSVRIRQILLNLLSNAFKYTENGFVSFSVRGKITDMDTVNLTIEIADSGRGIKPEAMGKLFEEFVQIESDKNRGVEGTGLGLAITRNLVSVMGGELVVSTDYGKGSTFTVILPQEIRQRNKLAAVENADKKIVLIFERREILAASIVHAMYDLGVTSKFVSTISGFFDEVESGKYSFIFIASSLYAIVKKTRSKFRPPAKIVLITEFGEAIAEQNVSFITTPIFSLPIANVLNGVSGNYDSRRSIAEIFAPEAKVLIVDDIVTNLKVTEGLMRPYGVQIKLCKSGQEAIEEVKSARYDLIFMDHMMPGMDGIEALSHIRESGKEEPYLKNVPVVALSANVVSGSKEMFLANGFDDYLSKPIDTSRLNSIIEKWLPAEKRKKRITETALYAEADKIITIEGVNAEKGIAMSGGNAQSYIRTLGVFYNEGLRKITEIGRCLETKDLNLYTVNVHGLKTALANIGAEKLSADAETLEYAGKNGDMAFIFARSDGFKMDFETLLNRINIFLSKEKSDGRDIDLNYELLKKALICLKTALNTLDSPGINSAIDILQGFTQRADIGGAVEKIIHDELVNEYDDAVLLIEALLSDLGGK